MDTDAGMVRVALGVLELDETFAETTMHADACSNTAHWISWQRTCPELLRAPRCRLVVFAIKVAGRWSREAVQIVRFCCHCEARSAPPHPRASSTTAWVQRSARQLSELGRARLCRFVVVGVEVGGRFGVEAAPLLRLPHAGVR